MDCERSDAEPTRSTRRTVSIVDESSTAPSTLSLSNSLELQRTSLKSTRTTTKSLAKEDKEALSRVFPRENVTDGFRNLTDFNEDTSRNMRTSQDSAPTDKSSREADRHAGKTPAKRSSAKAGRKANRRSIIVMPESKNERLAIEDARRREEAKASHEAKARPNTYREDSLSPSAHHAPEMKSDRLGGESEVGRPDPVVDPRKMLQLMRTTRGRMQGALLYRRAISLPWVESQCSIDVDSGSLCAHRNDEEQPRCLMHDLRKCTVRAILHSESRTTVLHLTAMNEVETLQIRPLRTSYLNAWFAALLCWNSVQIGQSLTDRREQQRPNLVRQISNYLPVVDSGSLENPIRKVGGAVLIEVEEYRPTESLQDMTGIHKTKWTSVSCLLNARGELRLLSKDRQLLATIFIADLPRSAVQHLGLSVLGTDCVVAIYPQYAQSTAACSRLRPIYLSFDSRELFEAWFVLLRAHAIPELYGTNRMQATSSSMGVGVLPGLEPPAAPMLFRLERSLHVKLNKVKIAAQSSEASNTLVSQRRQNGNKTLPIAPPANYFVELLLDGQVKAKSSIKHIGVDLCWYEQFDFFDFATALSSITIRLKRQETSQTRDEIAEMSAAPIPGVPPPEVQQEYRQRNDSLSPVHAFKVHGEALIETSMLAVGVDVDAWHPMTDDIGHTVGEVSVKIRQEEDTVLMDREYDAMAYLLHNFSNALTLQIYERIPLELGRLSVCLLNVFQVSGQACDWLMSLVEEEVDGVREQAIGRTRFTHRLDSRESHESLAASYTPTSREDVVRELNKSATAEAHLLFRGNTLLTKALDFHMQRVGCTYLEDTIGPPLRQIANEDIDSEVDPAKASAGHDITKAWKRLLYITETLWDRIRDSARRCPSELRTIFRHIRACANDRYGDFMRMVTYSSVSGFLFLRFFCAAVLNPYLFGLLDVVPLKRAQRTFTIVAKSLNGLASMSTFGDKEPWMTPMNSFLNRNRQAFKAFIDDVCAIRSDEPADPMPTSYSAPIAIYQKLPVASREGFPSLPHLIDRAKNLAMLVDIWLEGLKDPQNEPLGHGGSGAKLSNSLSGDLARFHDACLSLRQRTRAAWHSADRSEAVPSGLAHKWVATAERMETAPEEFWGVSKAPLDPAIVSPTYPQKTKNDSASDSRIAPKSSAARRLRYKPDLASLALTSHPSLSLAPPRPLSSTPSRSRTASQPTDTMAASVGLNFSSAPSSEDEADFDGRKFVIRTLRDLSGERLPEAGASADLPSPRDMVTPAPLRSPRSIRDDLRSSPSSVARQAAGKRRIKNPYMDLTLTPETLHGRKLGLGEERRDKRGCRKMKQEGKWREEGVPAADEPA